MSSQAEGGHSKNYLNTDFMHNLESCFRWNMLKWWPWIAILNGIKKKWLLGVLYY